MAQSQGRRSAINVSYSYGGMPGSSAPEQFGTPSERQQYGWGDPSTMSGGQDVASQFRTQFQPNAGIFSPSFPMVPVEPELARLWDYPVGYNYIYTPRSYEPVSFEELRALARTENLTRLAIETRKDQIEKLTWEIKPTDEKSAKQDADPRIKTLTKFWEHPDGERPFATWLREILEDVMVIDAPCLELLKNRDGSLRGLDIIDGLTIKLLIDITGRRPTAPAPAFQQIIHGRPWRLFTADELLYAPRNKRPGHLYGYSAVEQILTFINIAIRRQLMQLNHFTEGNVPPGLLNIPDLNAQQVAALQQWMDDKLAGNFAERQRLQMVPYATKYQALKEAPLKDDFDEWLARVVCFAFSLPPTAFVRQVNRATAGTAQETALEEGLAPLMGWVKRLVDSVIQKRQGAPDLEFAWQEIKEADPKVQADVLTEYLKFGAQTPNEVRAELGLDPDPDGDKLMVIAGNQVMLLQDIETISAHAANPPAPMFGAGQEGSGGPAAGRGAGAAPPRNGAAPATGTPGNAGRARSGGAGGAQNGGAGARGAGNQNGPSQAAGNGSRGAQKSSGSDDNLARAVAWRDEAEARQLLRRSRAARVEAELRALSA